MDYKKEKQQRKIAIMFLITVLMFAFMHHLWNTDLAVSAFASDYQACKYNTGYNGLEMTYTNGFNNVDIMQGYHMALYEGFSVILGLSLIAIIFVQKW